MYSAVAANYIRHYAYQHGQDIYEFMNAHNIGHSVYGAIMDKAATGKHVVAHRLYGHHFVYDFPINDPENIPAFTEHLFSDVFTKQGLPIVPGKLLKDAGLLKCCDSLNKNWNFVNAFDVLSGTVSIFQGLDAVDKYFTQGMSISSFEDVAKTLGVGSLELAIAISSFNPFLLIGGALRIAAGLKGVFNDESEARVYFKILNDRLSIAFANSQYDIDELNKMLSIEYANSKLDPFEKDRKLSIEELNQKLGF